jgi:hypothetical protein
MSEQDVLRSYSARAGEYVAAFGRVERPSILALARGTLGGILAWYSLIHMPPEGVGRALDQFREALVPGGSHFVGSFAGDACGPFAHEVLRAYQAGCCHGRAAGVQGDTSKKLVEHGQSGAAGRTGRSSRAGPSEASGIVAGQAGGRFG